MNVKAEQIVNAFRNAYKQVTKVEDDTKRYDLLFDIKYDMCDIKPSNAIDSVLYAIVSETDASGNKLYDQSLREWATKQAMQRVELDVMDEDTAFSILSASDNEQDNEMKEAHDNLKQAIENRQKQPNASKALIAVNFFRYTLKCPGF